MRRVDVLPLPLARQIAARLAKLPMAVHIRQAMQFTAQPGMKVNIFAERLSGPVETLTMRVETNWTNS